MGEVNVWLHILGVLGGLGLYYGLGALCTWLERRRGRP